MKKGLLLFLSIIVICLLCATGCNSPAGPADPVSGPETATDFSKTDSTANLTNDSASETTGTTAPTTSACKHQAVVDEGRHATFSKSGLTEGSHCSLCGAVLKKQTVIPALGSDLVVGTDYFDREGETTYQYSYSFTLYDNDRFNLTTLKVGSDESYELSGEEGKFNYLERGVYELLFDSGREKMYAKIVDGKFTLCKKDGSALSDGSDKRPHGFTKVDITPRPGNSVYGYYDLAKNRHGKGMQELYYRLYAACEAFIDSDRDVKTQKSGYTVDKISLDSYVLTADEAVAVWKVFLVENPRYYWLSNTVSISGGVLVVNIDAAYAKADYRKSCDEAIAAMNAACKGQLSSGMSALKKALTIHDFVLGQMNYAYKADGKTPQDAIWAHNLVGSAEKKSGVCEAYAKTYQYLCRLNGLDCMVVTGYNGESHAWNVVSIDGKWYGVDCTFDETNTAEVSYLCFGMSADRMAQEYQADNPDNTGIGFLYQVPALSKRGVELVDLYKNGTLQGVYANADAALAAMTDAGAEYEIQLYVYERQGALLLAFSPVEHHITAAQAPKVKRITLRGKHMALGNGYSMRMLLLVDKTLELHADLDVYDLELAGDGALHLADNKLRCLGTSVIINIPVTGSMKASSPSEIETDTREHMEFWGEVKVYSFRQDRNAMFRNATEIVQVYSNNFDVYVVGDEPIPMRFGAISASEPGEPLFISITGCAKIYIGDIRSDYENVEMTLNFGKREEMPAVTLGKISCTYLYTSFCPKMTYVSTDVNGNDVANWEETVSLSEMKGPILTLEDPSMYNSQVLISIHDYKTGDRIYAYLDAAYKFSLNEKNQVVFNP